MRAGNPIHLVAIALATCAACARSQAETKRTEDEKQPIAVAEPTPAARPKPAPTIEKPARVIEIASKGNLLEFDTKKLTAKAGERVKLVFKNKATLDVMPHNWVLIRPGTADKVGAAGQEKGEKGNYIDPTPDVLAYTAMAKHGQTVDVTFVVPPAGKYEYICTVMGHWISMKGELLVEN